MKRINRYLSILLVLSMMLCSTFLFTVSTVEIENEAISIGVIGNPGGENELQPMVANACTGSYVPSSWTVNSAYQGTGMEYVCYLNGWSMSGNDIIQNGQIIGRYDAGHYMDYQWTVAHFHIYGDAYNTHYIL